MVAPGFAGALALIGFKVSKDNAWMVEQIAEVIEVKLRNLLTMPGHRKPGLGYACIIIFKAGCLLKMFVQTPMRVPRSTSNGGMCVSCCGGQRVPSL